MNDLITESLSQTLFSYIKKGTDTVKYQIPFVSKDGKVTSDIGVGDIDISDAVKQLLKGGASPLYRLDDMDCFLITAIVIEMESINFSEKIKKDIVQSLLDSISEDELKNLLPEHGNQLFKELLNQDVVLTALIEKGLNFEQTVNNRYGEDSIEIVALKKGKYNFFEKLIKYNIRLDFDLIYDKDSFNETTLRNEISRLNSRVNGDIKNKEDKDKDTAYSMFAQVALENKMTTLQLLNKWILKNDLKMLPKDKNKVKVKNYKM